MTIGDLRSLALVALAALLGPSCGRSELAALAREAAACGPGDTCVLAGQSTCWCGSPVNARRAQEVDEFAAHVNCGGEVVSCARQVDPRCDADAGACTATRQ